MVYQVVIITQKKPIEFELERTDFVSRTVAAILNADMRKIQTA
jgi:hypothetical protein